MWIEQGYSAFHVLDFVGLSKSTYYNNLNQNNKDDARSNNSDGRPIPGYSYNLIGQKVSDEQIKEWLMELISGDGYPYGYKKLTTSLQEDYFLNINHKKVYRLCKELDILRPQRELKKYRPKKLAKKFTIKKSNQLWQVDVKYGFIAGNDQFFFQLSLIDVFDRMVIDYHLGLNCKATDAVRTLNNALAKRNLTKGMEMPVVRTDNGPQFVSKAFSDICELYGIEHQRIPVKSPNLNAYIEAFHAILQDECYERYDFENYMEVYKYVSDYMTYYNNRRRHGSLKNTAPVNYYHKMKENFLNIIPFTA